jgi:hypothetical protein
VILGLSAKYSTEKVCNEQKNHIMSLLSNHKSFFNNNINYKIIRTMNVDFFDNFLLEIDNWVKKNCDIGTSWENGG